MKTRYSQPILPALALLLAVALAGCSNQPANTVPLPAGVPAPASVPAQPETEPPVVRLGVVLPAGGHVFITESLPHARAQLETLAERSEVDFDSLLLTASGEAAMADAVAEAIGWGATTVLLWPLDGQGLSAVAQQVEEAGARLVLYGGQLEGVAPAAAISGDDAAIGRWTGEYLARRYAQAEAPVGMLRFVGGSTATGYGWAIAAARTAALDEALADAGMTDAFEALAPDFDTGWDADTARAQMADWLEEAEPEQLAALRVIVTQDDALADAVADAVDAWLAEHPGTLRLDLITGVGANRETLERFERAAEFEAQPGDAGGAELLTYYHSPSFIRQAIQLADAAARGVQYGGEDITGQNFVIPTIEVDAAMVSAYRAGSEYAERYALA